MSFSDLVSGGAACGPSNPLQGLSKRFGQDRGVQMDRFDDRTAGESSGFRGHHSAAGPPSARDPAFFHQQAHAAHAFDMQPLQGALPLTAHAGQSSHSSHASPMSADVYSVWQQQQQQQQHLHPTQWDQFERNFRHTTSPAAITGQADAQWARDFSPSATMTGSATLSHATSAPPQQHSIGHRPMGYGHAPMRYSQGYSRMNLMHMAPSSAMPVEAHRLTNEQGKSAMHDSRTATEDRTQWDTAFTAMEARQGHASRVVEQRTEKEKQHSVNPADADELARTAGRLVSTVEHETNDKFKQSNFLSLMRKIRDRQAGIQGSDIVDTPQEQQQEEQQQQQQHHHHYHHADTTGASAQIDKGKGRAMADTAPSSQQEAMTHPQTVRTLPAFDPINATRFMGKGPGPATLADEIAGRQELKEMWKEEDEPMSAYDEQEHAARMRRMAFVGDGGDVELRQREDEAEFNKYQGLLGAHLGPAAAGLRQPVPNQSTSTMEEDMDELEGADFVGRQWRGAGGRGVNGGQAAEWDKLQTDWDEWQASSAGLEQIKVAPLSAASAPAYRFHAYNPYVGATATSSGEMSAASLPADMQSVLEREAAVQQDPTNADAWLELGVKQQENEREGLAIAALQRAIQLDPSLREAWLALAVSYTNETDRSAALEAVERWVDATPAYRALVRQHRAGQDAADMAGKATQTALERHEELIKLLIRLARHSSAQDDRIDADIQVALGVLFNASEEYDKAVDCFTTALHVRPDDWLMYNRLGATLSNSGRSSEALRYYQQALDLKPGFVRCHFNMSISCLNLQMYRQAAAHIYTALTLQSESVDLSRDAAMQEGAAGGVTSSSLWETLRVACELMDRPDLASLAVQHDLDSFDPSQFWTGEVEEAEMASTVEPTM